MNRKLIGIVAYNFVQERRDDGIHTEASSRALHQNNSCNESTKLWKLYSATYSTLEGFVKPGVPSQREGVVREGTHDPILEEKLATLINAKRSALLTANAW